MYADPEWMPQAQAWFERRIRQQITNIRDTSSNEQWCRDLLQNDDAVEWLVEWHCDRALQFVQWRDGWLFGGADEFDPDFPRGQWVYDRKKVNHGFYDVARAYQQTLVACDTLDEWLTALYAGTLGPGPEEPAPKPELHTDARWRRRTWPRACRTCGESFTPGIFGRVGDSGNTARCLECCAKTRAPRRTEYDPVDCKDCGTSFRPHHHAVNRCPECRAKWLAQTQPRQETG